MLEKLLNWLKITNTEHLSAADFRFSEVSDNLHKRTGYFAHIEYGCEMCAMVKITPFGWLIVMVFIKESARQFRPAKEALSKIKGRKMFLFSPTKAKCLALVRDQIFVPKKR